MTTDLPGAGTTERGFGTYTEFEDLYGTTVTVQQSSLATEDAVWIQAHGGVGTPHLNVEQARWVRDALAAFIAEVEQDQDGVS